jgi:hypothetical protein
VTASVDPSGEIEDGFECRSFPHAVSRRGFPPVIGTIQVVELLQLLCKAFSALFRFFGLNFGRCSWVSE